MTRESLWSAPQQNRVETIPSSGQGMPHGAPFQGEDLGAHVASVQAKSGEVTLRNRNWSPCHGPLPCVNEACGPVLNDCWAYKDDFWAPKAGSK